MKRLITAGILSLIIIATCTMLIIKVNYYEDSMQGKLDEIEKLYEQKQYDVAYDIALQTEATWVEAESVLSLFIADKNLADLGEEIAALPPIIKSHNDNDFYIQQTIISTQLTHLKKYESLHLYTIF